MALLFLLIGIDRIDEDARGTFVFRPLLVPAILLLWPLVLYRWALLETGRDTWRARYRPERRVHGAIWAVLSILLPLSVLGGLSLRQAPSAAEPILLEAPE